MCLGVAHLTFERAEGERFEKKIPASLYSQEKTLMLHEWL